MIQIVFEVASCPWTDYLAKDDNTATSPLLHSTSDIHKTDPQCNETILQSILLRARYGGMAGDVKMLKSYGRLWRARFALPTTPGDIDVALKSAHASVSDDSHSGELNWFQVPELIHRRAKLQSGVHVTALVKDGIDKLLLGDVCLEGVDFHCSGVLDQLLANEAFVETLHLQLEKLDGIDPAAAFLSRRAWLESVLKKCMWDYSSSVNLRRPIANANKSEQSSCPDQLKIFWESLVAPKAREYMDSYVRDRLS